MFGEDVAACERFDRVVALDAAFSEGHGGLAVPDVVQGDPDSARRRADIAASLDRRSADR